MRTLYFDCFAGASGDMILGALVAAGADAQKLREQLQLLDVSNFDVSFHTVDRSGISATRAEVRTEDEKHHRHLSMILKIIERSRLSASVKARASRIFARLAEAEARVHNVAVESVHFHEVGAMDAIIDVVGACIGFELLNVERFVASPLHTGSGTVEMAHGRFPVPPPAVVELLRDAPTYATDIQGELLTPTGAAIISTLCESYGAMPMMRVASVGYGAGGREYERFPNVLRVMIGETEGDAGDERLLIVETNLDDVSPQIIGHLMERAFERGALDCYFTPVQMKKNRPGVLISILCHPQEREAIYQLLFNETTTLGVRSHEVARRALPRESMLVQTEFGAIRIKVARTQGRIVNASPEYDDCRAAARKFDAPLRDVEAAARAAFLKTVMNEKSL
ncbi:MAG: pyridinium-3,5-bisthiocarboxylic acid mononucleotide nickel chelatase [Acidobacteriota bacterium]|nr:pyridinium-3,5-bisthiocarboxylic acid mononucleotide nickel chelatase [Acidobacteriota bacterium]